MARFWVAVLNISDRVAQKIIHVHGIEPSEIEEAVLGRDGLLFAWNHDDERGWRALGKVSLRGGRALIVLYPTDDDAPDEWNLGSAYYIERH